MAYESQLVVYYSWVNNSLMKIIGPSMGENMIKYAGLRSYHDVVVFIITKKPSGKLTVGP